MVILTLQAEEVKDWQEFVGHVPIQCKGNILHIVPGYEQRLQSGERVE